MRRHTKDYKIYFEFDKSSIAPHYKENDRVITEMLQDIDGIGKCSVDSIVVEAKASPEGLYEHNTSLAERRTASMRDYIVQQRPDVEHLVRMKSRGEAWGELKERIIADTLLSDDTKAKAVEIIDADTNIENKKWRISQLPTYKHLRAKHYPTLRYSNIRVVYQKPDSLYRDIITPSKDFRIVKNGPLVLDSLYVERTPHSTYKKKELFYLRTNLLVPALNIGAEVAIGNYWSIGADFYFPWIWRNDKHKACFQMLAWSVEGRYWFGRNRLETNRLEGHSVGLFGSFGYFDFEKNYAGNQAEFVNVGVDYLYSLPIFKNRMHIEFSLGVGYIYSYLRPYKVYEDGGKGYKEGYTKDFHWFGPTKATVSLVIPIGGKRRVEQ